MKETDLFRFGKYKGRALWVVIRDDPRYVAWLARNVDGFRLDPAATAHLAAVRRAGV